MLSILSIGCYTQYDYIEDLRAKEIKGIITEKKYIRQHHGTKLLFIDTKSNTVDIDVRDDRNNILDQIEVGDSISKGSNTFKVEIYKAGKNEPKIVAMKFRC